MLLCFFFFQAEDGIRDLVRSRGLGDVYKRQVEGAAWLGIDDRDVLDGAIAAHGELQFHPAGNKVFERALRVYRRLSLIHI